MAAIARISIESAAEAPSAWAESVAQVRSWALRDGIALRDTIVLLPFAQLLGAARQAFAESGGWLPRIETTQTLARSLGPAQAGHPSQLSFDSALDRLTAARMLRAQRVVALEAATFESAVAALVGTAQALANAAAAVPPRLREAHWANGRALLGAVAGPGGPERWLARVAFEWAAASAGPTTDTLFGLRPAAWVAFQVAGPDALAQAVMADAAEATPCIVVDTDAAPLHAFATPSATCTSELQLAVCSGFEDEAQRCAGHVLDHLNQGRAPVAVIASDRILVRRVRALLARQNVPLLDETGWKLSTTRAGSVVAGLLRAAMPRAATDTWLDWLKSGAFARLGGAAAALAGIESTARRHGWMLARDVAVVAMPAPAAGLWRRSAELLATFNEPASCSVADWLRTLRTALQQSGQWEALCGDDAGRQLLAALHLADTAMPAALDDSDVLSLTGFVRWVDAALEETSFRPAAPPKAAAVVVTPLERALLRPFAAVVFPAADAKRLGAPTAPHPLLGDSVATALGLPGVAARRQAETLAFAQLLRVPVLTLLYRSDDAGEPLMPSPLVERLALARARAGLAPLAVAADPRRRLVLPHHGVARPMPSAPALLPASLSASACEALRVCPYRFFALNLLGLRAAEELDDVVEKRDYGSWLHAVLHRFHHERSAPADTAAELVALVEIGDAVRREQALDDAAFMPFAASFARLAPAYLAWLHERDAAGARWADGERRLVANPAEWPGIAMHGVVDRIDVLPGGAAAAPPTALLIDYKTGNAAKLRTLAKSALEDTQLVFYAALLARQDHAGGPLEAAYLPLDGSEALKLLAHPGVAADAQAFVDGMGIDLARLRAGQAMPALGEGESCTFCEARGLCRRDHWPATSNATT